jgi:hypothetical protein
MKRDQALMKLYELDFPDLILEMPKGQPGSRVAVTGYSDPISEAIASTTHNDRNTRCIVPRKMDRPPMVGKKGGNTEVKMGTSMLLLSMNWALCPSIYSADGSPRRH